MVSKWFFHLLVNAVHWGCKPFYEPLILTNPTGHPSIASFLGEVLPRLSLVSRDGTKQKNRWFLGKLPSFSGISHFCGFLLLSS